MTYKLLVQNSKVVLKTLAGLVLNITGIKDLLTGTGAVDSNNNINWNLQEAYKNLAWFTANPTFLLKEGQRVNYLQTGLYKIGDGTTQLQNLSFLGAPVGTPYLPIEETFTNVDGSTATTLAQTPATYTLNLYNDSGQRLFEGSAYSISGTTITWLATFESNTITAQYQY